MAKMYSDPRKSQFYKTPGIPVHQGPMAEAHFYPNVTDEMLKSGKYDIDWTLSYSDCMDKIKNIDDFHTPQMAFCNPRTSETHKCFIHKLDQSNDTQEIAIVGFDSLGNVKIIDWV